MISPLRPVRAIIALAAITLVTACTDESPTAPLRAPAEANPLIVQAPIGYVSVTQGGNFSCGARTDGAFECWGDNSYGQAPPLSNEPWYKYTAVSAGNDFTCALTVSNFVTCFGPEMEHDTPSDFSLPAGYAQIDAGGDRTLCAVRSDGLVYCSGEGNTVGTWGAQAGTFIQVSAGESLACAVQSAGAVQCWGYNWGGAVQPLVTPTSGKFIQVSVYKFHACAVRDDGVVQCWGSNGSGAAPATVTTNGGFKQVGVGESFSCGLRNDGVIECWGGATLTQQAKTGHFTAIDVSPIGFCALRSDGAAECYGGSPEQSPGERYSASGSTRVMPTADFSATPNAVYVGQTFALSLANAQVPGYPQATSFTYAFDCGSGYQAATTTSSVTCPASAVGTLAVKGKVIDQDNDVAEYSGTVTVDADLTPPVITANVSGTAGNNGWYTSNVTVSWTIADAETGVSSVPCASTTITTDTDGQTVSCSATSLGGTNTQSVVVMRDATAPALAPSVSPNPVLLGASATATPNATDLLSGLASSSCGSANTASTGSKAVSCTATDLAGNTANASATYAVTYAFSGFASPVDGGTVLNLAKAGQTIPLAWRLLDGPGNPITNLTSVTVSVTSLTCNAGAPTDDLEAYSAGNTGLQNLGNGYYQYNWKTPSSYAKSCKSLQLNMGEGVMRMALFQFK